MHEFPLPCHALAGITNPSAQTLELGRPSLSRVYARGFLAFCAASLLLDRYSLAETQPEQSLMMNVTIPFETFPWCRFSGSFSHPQASQSVEPS